MERCVGRAIAKRTRQRDRRAKRGRGVEDFAESIVKKVFGQNFQVRCTFNGPRGQLAKCDLAIPSKREPRILIESKGYGATGSKMTDILGDIRAIIASKRPDTAFLFVTDGLTWKQRRSIVVPRIQTTQ